MAETSATSFYKKTVLDNGVRIITESLSHIRSLSIGFWFDTGSRDEPDELSGIAHFLEHMNFKGTPKRNAVQIAREIEGRGGHLNAFTSKEATCYLVRVIDEQLPRALEVLSDITRNSIFDPDEIDRERNVILEELKNMEDTPDDVVFEYFYNQVFKPHSLSRSVLGNRESLQSINRRHLLDYTRRRYHGNRPVIVAAGHLNHDRFVKMIERRFPNETGDEQIRLAPSSNGKMDDIQYRKMPTQQAHIVIGCHGLPYSDRRKYTLLVLSTLFGGGMSSRLFQTIREKLGLAYTVFSFMETYRDTGLFGIYAGTLPERADDTHNEILNEVKKLIQKPIGIRELNRTKDQLKGNLILGLESPNVRMHRLAKLELNGEKFQPIDDIIAKIDAVEVDDIAELADELFNNRSVFTTMLLPN